MITLAIILLVVGSVVLLNLSSYNSNKSLWDATSHLRKSNRRYTPREMRALLEDERAERLSK